MMRLEVIEKHSGRVLFKNYYNNFTTLNLAIRKYKRDYNPEHFEFKISPIDTEPIKH